MASFAKIGLNNKVIEVISVHNNELLSLLATLFGNKLLIMTTLEKIMQALTTHMIKLKMRLFHLNLTHLGH